MNTENLTPAQIKATENGGTNNAVIGNSLVKRGIMADTGKGLHEYRFSITDEWIAYVTGETVETVRDFAAALESMDEEQKLEAIIEDAAEDAHYAETIGKEEDSADKHAGEYERAQIDRENEADRIAEIEALRAEFETADAARCEEIIVRLAQLCTVVYPESTPQYDTYAETLRAELEKFNKCEAPYDYDPEPRENFAPTHAETKAYGELKAEKIITLSTEYATASPERRDVIADELVTMGCARPIVVSGLSDAEMRFAEAVDTDDSEAQREILNAVVPEVAVRDPKETRYAEIERWTDDNLELKYGILRQRLGRRTLLKSDRQQAERQCQTVENELLRRNRRDVLEAYAKRF